MPESGRGRRRATGTDSPETRTGVRTSYYYHIFALNSITVATGRLFGALRPCKTIIYRFSISSSGRLWPFLNREILNVGPLRLRFSSIAHDQIQPKSERRIRQLIVLHNLTNARGLFVKARPANEQVECRHSTLRLKWSLFLGKNSFPCYWQGLSNTMVSGPL